MRRKLFFWELGGFLFTGALGTLLHFAYEWSGGSVLAACVSAVLQACLLGRNYPDFLAVRALSTLAGLALVPILFYTYTGALGRSVTWVNIAIFYLADLGAFLLDFALLRRGKLSAGWMQILGLAALWGLAFCFVWCTFHPVRLPLRRDPVTREYGIT